MSYFSRLLFPNTKYNAVLAGAYCSITGLAGYYVWNNHHEKSESRRNNTNLLNVQKSFLHSQPLKSAEIATDICGRIKCMKPTELTHLSAAHKPYSFVIGNCGLYNLSQHESDYDKLIHLGATKEWIELQIYNGRQFNLYLFPEKSDNYNAVCATWNGVYELLKQTEPEIYQRIIPFKQELQDTSFEDVESKSDFEFLDVYEKGPEDDRYLTKERFLDIETDKLSLVDVRFFLYCFMSLSRYFAGNGYTVDEDGNIGCKEYLIKNMKLDEMEQLKVVQLDVKMPN